MIDENQPKTIGVMVRDLSISIHRNVGKLQNDQGLKDMRGPQLMALGYLIRETKNGEVYSRDLEDFMNIRKSSVSGMVSRLIKNGYVRFEKSEKDGRFKRLIVTKEGYAAHEVIHAVSAEIESRLTKGFSEDQIELFKELLQKSIKNMDQ